MHISPSRVLQLRVGVRYRGPTLYTSIEGSNSAAGCNVHKATATLDGPSRIPSLSGP